jgi:hypothetical protein
VRGIILKGISVALHRDSAIKYSGFNVWKILLKSIELVTNLISQFSGVA